MMTSLRHRLLGLVVLSAFGASAIAAPPKEVQEILSWVPRDAAFFVHADVAKLWKTSQAEALRKANPQNLFGQLKDLSEAIGIAPDDVQTFTVFVPRIKANGEQGRVCLAFTLSKPHNAKQVVAGLNALAEIKKIPAQFGFKSFKQIREGVYAIEEEPVGQPKSAVPAKKSEPQRTLFLFDHPNRVVILGPLGNDLAKPQTVTSGLLNEAIAAATDGKTFTFSVNFANLPDEIRQENLPQQMEPFKPILHSEAVYGHADLGELLQMKVVIKTESRPKALEAEKSLGVFKTLMQALLTTGISELKNDESSAKLVGLATQTQELLRTMTISSSESEATASVKMKPDLDIAPLLELFGDKTSKASARATTTNNLKQLALAMHNYHDAHSTMPPSAIIGKKGKPLLSWRVAVLPFVEEEQLYKKFKLDEPWDSEHNTKVLQENPMPRVFEVVGSTKPGSKETHIQVFRGRGAMYDLVQGVKLAAITDGSSNTAMIATAAKAVPWTKPDDIEYDPNSTDPASWLLWINDVTLIAMGDGSVRAIAKQLKPSTLHAIITKSGGEVVND